MLKRTFDPHRPHEAVVYLRMSSDSQNKRSPDQQLSEILSRISALGFPWQILREFRDDAKSGRFIRSRPEYREMLQEIKSGRLPVDLILCDTVERFGRIEELDQIRRELEQRYGVLVLAADTNFADPTTPQGRALGMVETMRATEHGRILGHNVLRGKRDAARQKHWPGGKAPFGYTLQSVMTRAHGRDEVDHSILVPDEPAARVVRKLFREAEQTGWGVSRLARLLNGDTEIPDQFKPFHPATVGHWLDSTIYHGELTFEKNATGVVDDMRVVEANDPESWIRVPEFCEPLVTRELWDRVQALRDERRRRGRASSAERPVPEGGKQIEPLAPGLSLNYLLSGLVHCGECGRRMTISSSPEYTTTSGQQKRYVSYACPGFRAGLCPNGVHVREPWLRDIVVQQVLTRLIADGEGPPCRPE